jgi:hypothetical protein
MSLEQGLAQERTTVREVERAIVSASTREGTYHQSVKNSAGIFINLSSCDISFKKRFEFNATFYAL